MTVCLHGWIMNSNLFNSLEEAAVQSLLTLNSTSKKSLSADRLWIMNYFALFAKDFDFGFKNLYGDSLYNSALFATRQQLIKNCIKFLLLKELIERDITSIHLRYQITDRGKNLCRKFNSDFSLDYIRITKTIDEKISSLSDKELIYLIQNSTINKE
mgnify:CR=1 FL=1